MQLANYGPRACTHAHLLTASSSGLVCLKTTQPAGPTTFLVSSSKSHKINSFIQFQQRGRAGGWQKHAGRAGFLVPAPHGAHTTRARARNARLKTPKPTSNNSLPSPSPPPPLAAHCQRQVVRCVWYVCEEIRPSVKNTHGT